MAMQGRNRFRNSHNDRRPDLSVAFVPQRFLGCRRVSEEPRNKQRVRAPERRHAIRIGERFDDGDVVIHQSTRVPVFTSSATLAENKAPSRPDLFNPAAVHEALDE
jgi:hypothetical protein